MVWYGEARGTEGGIRVGDSLGFVSKKSLFQHVKISLSTVKTMHKFSLGVQTAKLFPYMYYGLA